MYLSGNTTKPTGQPEGKGLWNGGGKGEVIILASLCLYGVYKDVISILIVSMTYFQ